MFVNEVVDHNLQARVSQEYHGCRLDQVAKTCFSAYSRSCMQKWIKNGALRVDGKQYLPKYRLRGGENLTLQIVLQEDEQWAADPEVQFDLVFEDDTVLIINKPAGLVVHPAPGNWSGTLLNGLLHYCPALRTIPRAGIVHRLDKDTTGLMVVAKTLEAHNHLIGQLQARTVSREYEAIVRGRVAKSGCIEEPITRHPVNRLKMSVQKYGKPAITHYFIKKLYAQHTHMRLQLVTGRTHQIRVHMCHLGYPLIGDALYNAPVPGIYRYTSSLKAQLQCLNRQALHARRLGLIHPRSGSWMTWESSLPEDIEHVITVLEENDKTLTN